MPTRFRSRLRLRAIFLAATFLMPATAGAIVTRHDISDAAYLALESDYPALFGIYRTKAGHRDCIATLIAPQWALTAAHCTRKKALEEAAVPGGAGYPVSIAGQKALVDQIIRHPVAESDRAPDIALLRLREPVTHVAAIPLYRRGDELGRPIVMPGWGGAGNGKSGLSGDDGLFRVAENVVDRAEAGRLWWAFDSPGPNTRALTLEGISGPGDSGGPALLKTPAGWAVAGVSSMQDTKNGPEGLYGVDEIFVRVSDFTAWIDGHVGAR